MSNDPMYAVTMAAANLKAAAPDQFEKLLDAARLLEDKSITDFLAADAAGIFGAQGRANLARELRKRFEECLEKRKAYETRR